MSYPQWLCKWALNELWYGRYDSCPVTLIPTTAHDKMRSGADLNGDNLLISRAYLRISDHCRVTVRVRDRVRTRRIKVRFGLGFGFGLGLGLELRIVVYKLLEKATKCGSITPVLGQ